MSFNSLTFAVFFLTVYLLYLFLQHKAQNRLLLIASYVFYGFWDYRFLALILLSTMVDYFCGLKISESTSKPTRKKLLWISIGFNLTVLFFFKYFNFFVDSFINFTALIGFNMDSPSIRIILPVGISFYTFQTMSYTIDIYRKQMKPTRDFLDYALYVSFFPQLVAGPIERASRLLPQISNPRTISRKYLSEGAFLIYWGIFKKEFIVDNIVSILVYISSPMSAHGAIAIGGGGVALVSIYAFMFQLYGDFSAYSDIARGTARVMGFDIMVNFRAPFFAQNIQDVWNRWHISLTTWIRDYLYFPIAMTKFGKRSLTPGSVVIITFIIMGLWHGAAWNFVLWGAYSGTVLVIYSIIFRKTRKYRGPKPAPVAMILKITSIIFTFNVAAFGLLFFRANSLDEIGVWLYQLLFNFQLSPLAIMLGVKVFLFGCPILLIDLLLYRSDDITRFFHYPRVVRFSFLYITLYLVVMFRALSSDFIYFQF